MRVRSAAAPRRVRAIARAAAVAAAAPCAALRDGVRASVVGVVVACAGPLAPACDWCLSALTAAAAMNVLSLQQCCSLGSKRSGIEATASQAGSRCKMLSSSISVAPSHRGTQFCLGTIPSVLPLACTSAAFLALSLSVPLPSP